MDRLDEVAKRNMIKVDDKVSNDLKDEWDLITTNLNKLKEYDVKDIEPMVRISTSEESFLREDVPGEVMDKKALLENSVKSNEDFVVLPKVVHND